MLREFTSSGPPSADAGDLLVVVMPLTADDYELAALENLLAAEERARAARLEGVIRARFVAGRGRLRRLLADLLDDRPEAIEFEYGPWGKPGLAGRRAARVHFNLAHSADIGLAVLCSSRPVGVDIEVSLPMHSIEWSEQMAPTILGPRELPAWQRLPDGVRPAALLQAWVAKEAILKSFGCGIGGGLHHPCLPMADGCEPELATPWRQSPVVVEMPASAGLQGGRVGVLALDAVPGTFAAVACQGGMNRVVAIDFDAVVGGRWLRTIVR